LGKAQKELAMSRDSNVQVITNDEDWIVEIFRPGPDGNRYIKPARTRVAMERWCKDFNRDSGRDVPQGQRCPVARVIHRSDKKEFPDN
jgi:hypothetical protein